LPDLPALVDLALGGGICPVEALPIVSACRGLRRLDLNECPLTDDDLQGLAVLEALERLDLSRTSVSGAGIAHLKGLRRLTHLRRTHCAELDDDVWEPLAALVHLERLTL